MAGAAGAAGQDTGRALLAALCGDESHDCGRNGDGEEFDRPSSQTTGSTAGLMLLRVPTHPLNKDLTLRTFRAEGFYRSDDEAADRVHRTMLFIAQCAFGDPKDTEQIRTSVAPAFGAKSPTPHSFHSHIVKFVDILRNSAAATSHRGKDGKLHNPLDVPWSSENHGLDIKHAAVAMIDLDNEYPNDPLNPGRVLVMFAMNKTLGRRSTDLLCMQAKQKEKSLSEKQRSFQSTHRLPVGRLTFAISEGSAAPPASPADKDNKRDASGLSAKSGESVVIDLTQSPAPKQPRGRKSRKLQVCDKVDVDLT